MKLFDCLTQKVSELEVNLREKDKVIEELVDKVSNIDNVVDKLAETIPKINAVEEGKKEQSEKSIKCSNCSFTTNSKQGIQIHTKKKHTVVQNDTFSSTCNL